MHQCNFFHPACSAPKESTFSLATFLDFFQPHFSSLKQTGKQNTDLHSTVSPSDPWWEWSAFSAGFVVEVHRTLSCVSVFDIWQMETCSSLQSSPKCLHMISSFSGICWLSHGGGGRTVLLHQVLMIVLHYCQSCLFSIYSHESFFFFPEEERSGQPSKLAWIRENLWIPMGIQRSWQEPFMGKSWS